MQIQKFNIIKWIALLQGIKPVYNMTKTTCKHVPIQIKNANSLNCSSTHIFIEWTPKCRFSSIDKYVQTCTEQEIDEMLNTSFSFHIKQILTCEFWNFSSKITLDHGRKSNYKGLMCLPLHLGTELHCWPHQGCWKSQIQSLLIFHFPYHR